MKPPKNPTTPKISNGSWFPRNLYIIQVQTCAESIWTKHADLEAYDYYQLLMPPRWDYPFSKAHLFWVTHRSARTVALTSAERHLWSTLDLAQGWHWYIWIRSCNINGYGYGLVQIPWESSIKCRSVIFPSTNSRIASPSILWVNRANVSHGRGRLESMWPCWTWKYWDKCWQCLENPLNNCQIISEEATMGDWILFGSLTAFHLSSNTAVRAMAIGPVVDEIDHMLQHSKTMNESFKRTIICRVLVLKRVYWLSY